MNSKYFALLMCSLFALQFNLATASAKEGKDDDPGVHRQYTGLYEAPGDREPGESPYRTSLRRMMTVPKDIAADIGAASRLTEEEMDGLTEIQIADLRAQRLATAVASQFAPHEVPEELEKTKAELATYGDRTALTASQKGNMYLAAALQARKTRMGKK